MAKSWIPQKYDFDNFFKFSTINNNNRNNAEFCECLTSMPTMLFRKSNDDVSSNEKLSNIAMAYNENNNDVSFSEKLRNLSLLYDVPFSYLVPSENMLKMNEIRFFYLDSNWIRTLLDGASSIGRTASIDYSNDIEFLKDIYNRAISQNVNVRRQLQCKTAVNGLDIDLPCTGFLLRSQLVGGWRGMEFIAYSDTYGQNSLTALRLEALSSEILLGIYSGEIARLDIKEPPEGFHYGFDNNNGKLEKMLRSLDDGQLIKCSDHQSIKDASGKSIKDANDEIIEDASDARIKDANGQSIKDANNQSITNNYREQIIIPLKERGNRVIDFSDAANKIKQELFPNSEEKPNSTHIALEMIQDHYMLNIYNKNNIE